jgi:release factor glutamine methyltransferase
MSILEAIQKSTDFLAKKGVDSPRLQSELLLAYVLRTPRLKLYLDFARNLSEAETTALRELVQRRGNREPLQHILGTASFCGLEIKVNPHVLVPRPETELLAECGWKFLNSLNRESTFLDFGTGSGCIAIALCHHTKLARGWALDQSPEALAVAAENASRHSTAESLTFIESHAFQSLDPSLRFDLIISNPPYIPSAEIETLQEEVRDFDPRAALDGGADGLQFYRLLGSEAAHFLADGGKMMLEFGDGQETALAPIFTAAGWQIEAVAQDFHQKPRILVLRRA